MYKQILVDLAKDHSGEHAWHAKMDVWVQALGEQWLLTSSKGHAFLVTNSVIASVMGRWDFDTPRAYSAWTYRTNDVLLVFLEGIGFYVITDRAKPAECVALDPELKKWVAEHCPCWLRYMLYSTQLLVSSLYYGDEFLHKKQITPLEVEPGDCLPIAVFKRDTGYEVALNWTGYNSQWELVRSLTQISKQGLHSYPCVVLNENGL